jgi:adenylosuccinate lyase
MVKEREKREPTSPEVFIETWETSKNVAQVAERLGITPAAVHQKATAFRNIGVKLKKMPRRMKKEYDVEALNKLIFDLAKKTGRQIEEGGEDEEGDEQEVVKPEKKRGKMTSEKVSKAMHSVLNHE